MHSIHIFWSLVSVRPLRPDFASIFQYLRCKSCWRPHFIVFKFLHAPILGGGRWFNFKNCLAPPSVQRTGQSPASPGIHCVASYFQRISCSAGLAWPGRLPSNKDNPASPVDLELFLWLKNLISKPKWFGKNAVDALSFSE